MTSMVIIPLSVIVFHFHLIQGFGTMKIRHSEDNVKCFMAAYSLSDASRSKTGVDTLHARVPNAGLATT